MFLNYDVGFEVFTVEGMKSLLLLGYVYTLLKRNYCFGLTRHIHFQGRIMC
jgi:hypothetical protein